MLQHSIGDVGNLDHQSSSSLVAEGEGLVRLGVAQQADLRVAVGFQLQKGKFFTCRNHTINHYGIIYNMGGEGGTWKFCTKNRQFHRCIHCEGGASEGILQRELVSPLLTPPPLPPPPTNMLFNIVE